MFLEVGLVAELLCGSPLVGCRKKANNWGERRIHATSFFLGFSGLSRICECAASSKDGCLEAIGSTTLETLLQGGFYCKHASVFRVWCEVMFLIFFVVLLCYHVL